MLTPVPMFTTSIGNSGRHVGSSTLCRGGIDTMVCMCLSLLTTNGTCLPSSTRRISPSTCSTSQDIPRTTVSNSSAGTSSTPSSFLKSGASLCAPPPAVYTFLMFSCNLLLEMRSTVWCNSSELKRTKCKVPPSTSTDSCESRSPEDPYFVLLVKNSRMRLPSSWPGLSRNAIFVRVPPMSKPMWAPKSTDAAEDCGSKHGKDGVRNGDANSFGLPFAST
mmetsp:Transcript_85113/g.237486  ORF Transcript_85113/g.237486 Transcript_85113/m.237486 type:complete len:220 (+) Transcript_85113:1055-1714(+)